MARSQRWTPGQLVKHLRGSLLHHSGLFRARLRRLGPGHRLALTYHRVLPRGEGGRFLEPGLYVEPGTFESHLRFLKQYLLPCSLEVFLAKAACSTTRPRCLLTFDDGWEDFHRYAFPRLVAYGVPAVVFLPTAYVGTGRRFWSERLAALYDEALLKNEGTALQTFLDIRLGRGEGRRACDENGFAGTVQTLKSWREERIEELLRSCEDRFGRPRPRRADFMSWEQIEEIRRSGLVNFGSHGDTHRLLTTLTRREIAGELRRSRERLAARDCIPPAGPAFCYPNGDFDATEAGLLEDYGYTCGFTTRRGWNDEETPVHALRRLGIHQDVSRSAGIFLDRIYFSAPGVLRDRRERREANRVRGPGTRTG